MEERVEVARIGRPVGFKGELKLFLDTDFPEQFKKNASFDCDGRSVVIEYFYPDREVVKFLGIDSSEEARLLTGKTMATTVQKTKEQCKLGPGEYFWFEIIGCLVVEAGEVLGVVERIERFAATDYLVIRTDPALKKRGYAKSFLLPYIDPYIESADIKVRRIFAKGAMGILEAS